MTKKLLCKKRVYLKKGRIGAGRPLRETKAISEPLSLKGKERLLLEKATRERGGGGATEGTDQPERGKTWNPGMVPKKERELGRLQLA